MTDLKILKKGAKTMSSPQSATCQVNCRWGVILGAKLIVVSW